MRSRTLYALALTLAVAGGLLPSAQAQAPVPCRPLDNHQALRFVPDRVPFEADSLPVDAKAIAALEFPDKARIAIAPLLTSGSTKTKYEFVMFSESRFVVGGTPLPSGLIGLGFEPGEKDAPTRTLIARDFTGSEIGRFCLELDPATKVPGVALVPTGAKTFELRIGSYAVEASQK